MVALCNAFQLMAQPIQEKLKVQAQELGLFVAYYNLVREHQAIGKTPAQAAGIDLKLGICVTSWPRFHLL